MFWISKKSSHQPFRPTKSSGIFYSLLALCVVISMGSSDFLLAQTKTSTENKSSAKIENKDTKEARWDKYFKRKMFDPPVGFVVEGLKRVPKYPQGQVAIDLGSGVGHETMVLLRNGFKVVAVDSDANSFKYMMKQRDIGQYQNQLTTVVSEFENLNYDALPQADLIIASFSLPFVSKDKFETVWNKIMNKLKPGGYFIGNLFDPGFTYFGERFRPKMTFHNKEQAIHLVNKDFKIIDFKAVHVDSLKKGTKNYYYVFVARKLPNGDVEMDVRKHHAQMRFFP